MCEVKILQIKAAQVCTYVCPYYYVAIINRYFLCSVFVGNDTPLERRLAIVKTFEL